MTNKEIIFEQKIILFKEGILKSTGNKFPVTTVNPDGIEETKWIPEIEEIHTFNGWIERGRIVRKGEKSHIKFPIWKFSKAKYDDEGNIIKNSKAFLKTASWFTKDQTEEMKVKGE